MGLGIPFEPTLGRVNNRTEAQAGELAVCGASVRKAPRRAGKGNVKFRACKQGWRSFVRGNGLSHISRARGSSPDFVINARKMKAESSIRRLLSQHDVEYLSHIKRGAMARTSKANSVSGWTEFSSAALANENWIYTGELLAGTNFPHSLAKSDPKLFSRQDHKRYVILTENALFLTMHTGRKYSGKNRRSDEDEEVIQDIIKKYDEDSSGGLDMEEFKRFLKEAAGGDPPTDNEVMWVAQTATPERLSQEELKNLQIKIEHLRSALLAWSDYKERQLEINGIFNKYDKDGDADLDQEELKDFVRDLLEQKDMRTVAENSKDKREAVSQNLQKSRHARVEELVHKVLKECDDLNDGVIRKPEMIKALVVIQNEGEETIGEIDDKSSLVVKMQVKLECRKKPANWTDDCYETTGKYLSYDNHWECFQHAVQLSAVDKMELIPGLSLDVNDKGDGCSVENTASTEVEMIDESLQGQSASPDKQKAASNLKMVVVQTSEPMTDENMHSVHAVHFSVKVHGNRKNLENFKVSRSKLRDKLQKLGWDVKLADVETIFTFFPDSFEITDLIPLTEISLPLTVDRLAEKKASRDAGIVQVFKGLLAPVRVKLSQLLTKLERKDRVPVAISISLSLPMRAHIFEQDQNDEKAKVVDIARKGFSKIWKQATEPSIQIRDIKAIAGNLELDTENENAGEQQSRVSEYKYDLFLSYRVSSDVELVEKLYDKITRQFPELRVFWDKRALVLGEAWGQGFGEAITNSRMVALVMSRGTFSCKHGKDCKDCPENVARLDRDPSYLDNVILEYDLALEMFEVGRVHKIVPVLVGDTFADRVDDPDHGTGIGTVFGDFFHKFKPCVSMEVMPKKVASEIRKRALHMLNKDAELKVQIDSRAKSSKKLIHPKLREGIPSLLSGERTVHDTLTAVLAMQGIKVMGIPDVTIQNTATTLGEAAMDVMNIAEREIIASDALAGTTMDHTSVTILVDAFAHQPAADTDAVIQTYKQGMETSGGIEIGDRTLHVYETTVRVEYDNQDGLGAVLVKSSTAEGARSSVTSWNIQTYDVHICGRQLNAPGLWKFGSSHHSYLRVYIQAEDYLDKELLCTTPPGNSRENPDWSKLSLRLSDEFAADGSMCFSLEVAGDEDGSQWKMQVGAPVTLRLDRAKSAGLLKRGPSISNRSARAIKSQVSRIVSSFSGQNKVRDQSFKGSQDATALLDQAQRGGRKFGIIKEIRNINDFTDQELEAIDHRTVGVDFSTDANEDLIFFTPDELEVLHVGDKLDTVIIECVECGTDAVIGSCITNLGMLASGRAELFALTNDDLLGSWPFSIETNQDVNSYSMGCTQTLRARSNTQCSSWVRAITKAASRAQHSARYEDAGVLKMVAMRLQDVARAVNGNPFWLCFVYLTIVASFISSIVTHDMIPNAPYEGDEFEALQTTKKITICSNEAPTCKLRLIDMHAFIHKLEFVYTAVFTLDLVVNLVANWFLKFLSDPFNYLDVLVVVLSWLGHLQQNLSRSDGAHSGLRIVRVFRLVRVFKLSRWFIEARVTFSAMSRAIQGMLPALVLLLVFTALGAIVTTATLGTDKPEHFGRFWLSLYTMWSINLSPSVGNDIVREILELESWSDQMDGMQGWPEVTNINSVLALQIFFGFYSFLMNVIFNNIIMIVFLREFLLTTVDEKRNNAHEQEQRRRQLNGDRGVSLEPLLVKMIGFKHESELGLMIADLYRLFQPVTGQGIGFTDLQSGLRKFHIHINRDDWVHLTEGVLRPRQSVLDEEKFARMMREQLRLFTTGELNGLMNYTDNSLEEGLPPLAMQRAIKMLPHATRGGEEAHGGRTGQGRDDTGKRDATLSQLRQELAAARHEIETLKSKAQVAGSKLEPN